MARTSERNDLMRRMNDEVRTHINNCFGEAREARHQRDWIQCWSLLEAAHIRSQPRAWMHVRVHESMFVADNFGANPNDIVRVASGAIADLKRSQSS